MEAEKLLPEMEIFRYFKGRSPDAVIFFQMEDSYEAFYEDARTCADVLGVTMFNRNENSDNPIPFVRVPSSEIEGCFNAMLQAGHKVAAIE